MARVAAKDRREGSASRHPAGRGVLAGLAVLVVLVAGVGPTAALIPAGTPQTGPTATLAVTPNPAHPGETVVLDGRNSTAPDTTVQFCEFDVDGDGTYDVQRDDCLVDYAYADAGEYDVGLRITTEDGREVTDTETLVVRENQPPEPEIAVDPSSPVPGESVTLSAVGSADTDGDIVAHTWTLPTGTANGETVETAFENPGEYEVLLTVTDDDGTNATTGTVVAVAENEPPTAALSVDPAEATVGETIRFDAGGSVDPDGAVVAYRWDVDGDGTVDERTESPTLALTADAAGAFEATVVAVDDRGATDAATVEYAVQMATPTAIPTTTTMAGANTDDVNTTTRGATDGGLIPFVPDLLVALLLLLLAAGGAGVSFVLRRESLAEKVVRLRDLLARGDVRRRLARKVSGTAVKTTAKKAIRRFSDFVEWSGEAIGEAVERLGRAIKRGSGRLAEWLRRLGA